MRKTKVFWSRINFYVFGFILIIAVLLALRRGVHTGNTSGVIYINWSFVSSLLSIDMFIFLPLLLFVTGHHYVISENKLYQKVWFFHKKSANIADIISVERSYDQFSSPKLFIRFEKGKEYSETWEATPNWVVALVREQEFIEELKAINPDIYVRIKEKKQKWHNWDQDQDF